MIDNYGIGRYADDKMAYIVFENSPFIARWSNIFFDYFNFPKTQGKVTLNALFY